MPPTDRPDYPLAEVLWRLGEELRAVASLGDGAARTPIVEVTTATATLTVTVARDAKGGLSFGVMGVGAELGGGASKSTTTELTVDLKVAQRTGADGVARSAVSFGPPPPPNE
ncbi:trypco2 family protein [Cellulomonas sp. McL0617]|uniref:trypco2 family protein n=1 Tax=Cellulomonas sp. McL0617 TaxID=3415675 RepID=UPI003CEA5BF0